MNAKPEQIILTDEERAEKLSRWLLDKYPNATPERCKKGRFSVQLGGEFSMDSDTVYRVVELSGDGNDIIETVEIDGHFQQGRTTNMVCQDPVYTTVYPYKGHQGEEDSTYWSLSAAPKDIWYKFPDSSPRGLIPKITVTNILNDEVTEQITYTIPQLGYMIEERVEFWTRWYDEWTIEFESTVYSPKKVYRTK